MLARLFEILLLALISLTVATVVARTQPASISGVARSVDADIIAIGKQRVILWGIDAPERNQTCVLAGKSWDCWRVAMRSLQTLVDDREVVCTPQGPPDRLGRAVAICLTAVGVNLNEAMVAGGMAVAFREQAELYLPAERAAREAQVGLWQPGAHFINPWDWRRSRSPGGLR